jgi:hypothetical protein
MNSKFNLPFNSNTLEITALVLNILLYIDTTKNEHYFVKEEDIVFGSTGLSGRRRTVESGYIHIGKKLEAVAPDSDFDYSGTTPAYKVSCRFMVRGHWRRQPIGPRGAMTYIRKRIAPFIKGPDGAPFKESKYVVTK